MKLEKIPFIQSSTTFYWNCPHKNIDGVKCDEYNEVKIDVDGFDTPLICDECRTSFDDYESNI